MSNETKNGWALTRNLRGVRKVTGAKREAARWYGDGWRDQTGFIPFRSFFSVRDVAIAAARRNAEKMLTNAKADLAKLDKLAAQPEVV